MNRQFTSQPRNLAILHSIVQEYIETGEPVASRTVAHRIRENISPATVRNIMAALYEEGYLAQPHTSAGRITTAKAFQSYVHSLSQRRILSVELNRLRSELAHLETMQARVERSSHILTEMTHGLGIAAA